MGKFTIFERAFRRVTGDFWATDSKVMQSENNYGINMFTLCL